MPERNGKVISNGADLTGYSVRLNFTPSNSNTPQTSNSTNDPLAKGADLPQADHSPSSVQETIAVSADGTSAIGHGEEPARRAGLPDRTGGNDPQAQEWRRVDIELNGHVIWRLSGQ